MFRVETKKKSFFANNLGVGKIARSRVIVITVIYFTL